MTWHQSSHLYILYIFHICKWQTAFLFFHWVECMTSSIISFAYFTHFSNLNISGTNADICKRLTAFSFYHGILCDTLKISRGKNFDHSSTLSCVHIAYTLQIAKNNSNKVISIYLPVELPQLSVAVLSCNCWETWKNNRRKHWKL